MITIISNTPLYVWGILAVLIWGGVKSLRPYVVSWVGISILPLALFLYATIESLKVLSLHAIFAWAVCLLVGGTLGAMTLKKETLVFDKKKRLIHFSGSAWPILLSLGYFAARYASAVCSLLYPQYMGFCRVHLIIFTGMFLGRLYACYKKSKKSPHTDLSRRAST